MGRLRGRAAALLVLICLVLVGAQEQQQPTVVAEGAAAAAAGPAAAGAGAARQSEPNGPRKGFQAEREGPHVPSFSDAPPIHQQQQQQERTAGVFEAAAGGAKGPPSAAEQPPLSAHVSSTGGRVCTLGRDGTTLECVDAEDVPDEAAVQAVAAKVAEATAKAQALADAAAAAAANLAEAHKLEEQLQQARRLAAARAAANEAALRQQQAAAAVAGGHVDASALIRSDMAVISAAELDAIMQRIAQLEAAHAALLGSGGARVDLLGGGEAESLLEALGDHVKRFVVTRLTPRTDRECTFSFARWRCEPRCECGLQFRLGDYWPTRMCRRVPPDDRDPECSPSKADASDEPVLSRIGHTLRRWAGLASRAYAEHLAPPTDADCAFDLAHWRCSPSERCAFRFRWWDVTPSQACRLRPPDDRGAGGAQGGGGEGTGAWREQWGAQEGGASSSSSSSDNAGGGAGEGAREKGPEPPREEL